VPARARATRRILILRSRLRLLPTTAKPSPNHAQPNHAQTSRPQNRHLHHLSHLQHTTQHSRRYRPISHCMRYHIITKHSTRLPKPLPTANSATRSFVPSPLSNPAQGGKHSASLRRATPHSTGVGQVAVRGEVLRLAPARGQGTAAVGAGICCHNTSQGCSLEAWAGGFPYSESLQGGFW
jgi:uncharacterized protein involved in copper resistance